jgi:hypothetical protein
MIDIYTYTSSLISDTILKTSNHMNYSLSTYENNAEDIRLMEIAKENTGFRYINLSTESNDDR